MGIDQKKAGVVLSYLAMGINSIVSILYTPFMTRLLGQSEYGLYNIVFSFVSYLGLMSLGFTGSYIRFYTRQKLRGDKESIASLNGMYMLIFICVSLITLVIGTVFVFNVDLIFERGLTEQEIQTAQKLIALLVFNIALTFPASVFDSYLMANEKFFFHRLIALLRTVLNPLLALPLLFMGFKSISLVIVTTVLTITSLCVNSYYCFKKLQMKFSFRNFELGQLKEISIFSSYLFISEIVNQINWSVGKVVLGITAGTAAVAVFSLGAQLNTYYMSFSTSISTVFLPRINAIVARTNDNSELNSLFVKVGRIQFIVLSFISTTLIFFGTPIIRIFGGEGYELSYPVTLLLVLPVTIPLVQNIGIEIQKAKNMHRFRSLTYFFLAVLNVILTIPLSSAYGPVGAAVGTAVSLIIGNGIMMNWYYHKKVGIDIINFWKEILRFLPAVAVPSIFGVCVLLFADTSNIIFAIFLGGIFALIFAVSMWFLGFNKYEKALFKGLLISALRLLKRVMGKMKNNESQQNSIDNIIGEQDISTRAIAAYNTDEETRMQSSSGGVFSLLANDTIKAGGVVVGAVFDDDFNVVHSFAETKVELIKMYGSKYVKSKAEGCYKKTKELLESGRRVYFSGTPCQIAALKAFLKNDYDNLLCQDIICHGTPEPSVWSKYLSYIEEKYNFRAKKISFRDKSMDGWLKFSFAAEFENGKTIKENLENNLYLKVFLSDIALTRSCYNCSFKGISRQADITLADFWGVQKEYPEMFDNKGTSLILIHSDKGQCAIEAIKQELKFVEVQDVKKAVSYNPAALRPASMHPKRQEFFEDMDKLAFDELAKKYCSETLSERFTTLLKKAYRKIFR